jgi:hypothetical protein
MPRRHPRPFGRVDPDNLAEETVNYNKHWNALLPSKEEQDHLRDVLYGCRVEDSPWDDASFMVRCSCSGILGDGLTITQARDVVDSHVHN